MDNFLNLNFVGRQNGPTNSQADVSISKTKKGYSITFRHGVGDKIGEYAMIAVSGNAIFFKADINGWKISGNDSKDNKDIKYLRVGAKALLDLDRFVGDYELKYFNALGLYYIENPKHGGSKHESINKSA